MSAYYYLGCGKCKELIHISQGNGDVIYYGDKECMIALGHFLKKHEYCDRLFYSDEHNIGEPKQGYTTFKEGMMDTSELEKGKIRFCEKCKTPLNPKNNSPSEIHDYCKSCWLKSKEGRSASEGLRAIIRGEG